jgi:hypothetical protein
MLQPVVMDFIVRRAKERARGMTVPVFRTSNHLQSMIGTSIADARHQRSSIISKVRLSAGRGSAAKLIDHVVPLRRHRRVLPPIVAIVPDQKVD